MPNITLDENIPYAEQAFSTLGTVKLLAGRSISHTDLQGTDGHFQDTAPSAGAGCKRPVASTCFTAT